MLSCIILAGGLGTRLSAPVPKCVVPVNNKPFLFWVIKGLQYQGVEDIILSLGYKADSVISTMKPIFDVRYVVEKEPLGTGGAIRYCLESTATADSVLIVNGDSFVRFNLKELKRIFSENTGAVVASYMNDCSSYGRISIDEDGRIVGFIAGGGKEAGIINAGIWLFDKQKLLDYIPKGKASLEYDVLPNLISKESCFAYTVKDPLFDIGTPDRLKTAESFFKSLGGEDGFLEYIREVIL